ncbi:hypothetical protein ABLE94_09595 [Gordonia sp. VNK1]|uniref:hypothetical protein n=1 Tax=Gordonia oleivorans TaxID=3156618 RepID=UPI0032B5F52E
MLIDAGSGIGWLPDGPAKSITTPGTGLPAVSRVVRFSVPWPSGGVEVGLLVDGADGGTETLVDAGVDGGAGSLPVVDGGVVAGDGGVVCVVVDAIGGGVVVVVSRPRRCPLSWWPRRAPPMGVQRCG